LVLVEAAALDATCAQRRLTASTRSHTCAEVVWREGAHVVSCEGVALIPPQPLEALPRCVVAQIAEELVIGPGAAAEA